MSGIAINKTSLTNIADESRILMTANFDEINDRLCRLVGGVFAKVS
jgi:hypothetical protein